MDGIVVAPLDKDALVRPVEEPIRSHIPVVVVDSDLSSSEVSSFIATDKFKGGEAAADQLGKLLGGRGKVLIMRTSEGAKSSLNREAGFLKRMRLKSGWEVSERESWPTFCL